MHGLMDILVQPGYGSGDIGIERVDIAVKNRRQKLQAEQKTHKELRPDLNGLRRHVAEKIEGGAQILDMCVSGPEMALSKMQERMAEHVAEFFVQTQQVIGISGTDLKGVKFAGELRLAAVSVDLKGKGKEYFVSCIGITFEGAVLFDLRMALSLDHAVDFDDVGVIVHDQRRGRGCKIPVGYISEAGYFVLFPYDGLVFLRPGKFVE